MTPMIDVIFLLLTFFIYTLVIRVEFLPVTLAGVNTGQKLTETKVVAITISQSGEYFINQEHHDPERFLMKIREISLMETQPLVVVAMEVEDKSKPVSTAAKRVDRGPVMLNLIQILQSAGIKNFKFAGPPNPPNPNTSNATTPSTPSTSPINPDDISVLRNTPDPVPAVE